MATCSTGDVPFGAIDDDLDEPTESVEVHLTGACAAGATSYSFVTPALANVESGDYTIKTTVSQETNGQVTIKEASSGTVSVTGNGFGKEIGLTVNVTRDKQARAGVDVTLERLEADELTDAKIVKAGSLVDSQTVTTNANGDADFTIRGIQSPGDFGGKVTYTIKMTNADKRPQGKTFTVTVKP
jgi:hypothetical protein